ncbi:MAG: hypothetical protein HQK50_08090 [Oligoflexia bacterium]|nr:hypothetical protein [Oligoflexia bacterium]MBF0365517.1 hypothetical protein [Oligoflexia bacterium]
MKKKIYNLISFLILFSIFSYSLQVCEAMEIVGHRGASADAPENTLESMQLAWQQGAIAAECDVMLTQDSEIILMHDDSTKRTTGGKTDLLVSKTNWQELADLDVGSWKGAEWKGVKIPLLRTVVNAIPEQKKLFIEIKSGDRNEGADPNIIAPLLTLLDQEKVNPLKIIFISFDHAILKQLKKLAPQYESYFITTFQLYPGPWIYIRSEQELNAVIKSAKDSQINGIDLEYTSAITKEWILKIKNAGLKVSIWSYANDDTLANAQKMKTLGVDYYTTNYPGKFKNLLVAF